MAWHYVADGASRGPFTLEEIRSMIASGTVTADTLVWSDGMPEWVAARDTALSPYLRSTPPPVPAIGSPTPPPVSGPSTPVRPVPAGTIIRPSGSGASARASAWLSSPYEPPRSSYEAPSGAGAHAPGAESLKSVAVWARGLFFGYIVTNGFLILAYLASIGALEQIMYGGLSQREIEDLAETTDGFTAAVELISIGIGVLIAIFFLIWTYRAMANLHRNGAKVSMSAGWAVGWYFIPIANLWKPLEGMSQIYRASKAPMAPETAGPGGLLGWWWATGLVAAIISGIGSAVISESYDIEAIQGGLGVLVLGALIETISVILVIVIINSVTKSQAVAGISADRP